MKKIINKNKNKDKNRISKFVLKRPPIYLKSFHELDGGFEYISFATIAKKLNCGFVVNI